MGKGGKGRGKDTEGDYPRSNGGDWGGHDGGKDRGYGGSRKGGKGGKGKGKKGGGGDARADGDMDWRGGGASAAASRPDEDRREDRRRDRDDWDRGAEDPVRESPSAPRSNGSGGALPSQDVRYENAASQDVRYESKPFASQDVRYESKPPASQDVRYESKPFASQDVRYESKPFASQDVRYENRDEGASLDCQDVRYMSQDVRYNGAAQEAKAKTRSRNGRKGGGDGEGGGKGGKGGKSGKGGKGKNGREGGEATEAAGGSERKKGRNRGRGGKGGAAPPEDWDEPAGDDQPEGSPEQSVQFDSVGDSLESGQVQSEDKSYKGNKALTTKIRKTLQSYEESLEFEELGKAYAMLEESWQAGEGICDVSTLTVLLVSLTRVNKLANAQKVIDAIVDQKAYLDPVAIISIVTSISQRSQSHKALRYLRRLIYDCLPEDFGKERTQFFDHHVSFIFSELMAEADGCFGRMENRDPNALVNLGHAELDIQMDWKKSTGSSFVLFNRETEDPHSKKVEKDGEEKVAKKVVYQPTVFGMGFQRTDSALMSFDISHPDVAKEVARDYDRIRDGAEVEVVSSAGDPNKQAPLGVRLTSPPKVPFRPGMLYRLDRLASRDQTRRMLDALKVVIREPVEGRPARGSQEAAISSLQPSPILRELILCPPDTTLTAAGKAHLQSMQMDFNGDKVRQAGLAQFQEESKHAYNHLLNKSQLEALTLATSLRLTLIQGPPGTGKTTTAVQIVSALVQYGLVDLPMLVTADSNTAVDNLVKGIGKKGLKVVRVGRPESIREDVKAYALDGRWKELKQAEVVCATCIGASGATLDKVRFSTVLIDECTQAAESAALVPIARGCQQAILIGDQCQLPPTVLSDVAENENLGESLFTRLVTQGVRPVLLDTQYRMHPLIAEFASAAFYNGRLQNGVSHIHRKPPEGFPWPQRQMPVAFVNLERGEEKREGSSYINPAEAEKTLWALLEVCKNDQLGPEDVGIVTPYKGQVNFIKKLIRERPGLQKFRSGLEVESVDGFQGQEKEVIIFCAVRNNREGKVGFLSDWRRLNVMLTRARSGVIVIGSKSTLMADALWHEWMVWAMARGAICGESAKGTWQPKYLVDDRDGVWTIKAQVIEEVASGKPGAAAPATSQAAKQPEEVMDSWEDIGSPVMTPVNSVSGGSPLAELKLDEPVEGPGPPAAEEAPLPAAAAPTAPAGEEKTVSRAQEARAEQLRSEAEAAEELARLQIESSMGGLDSKDKAERTPPGSPEPKSRSKPAEIGGNDDEIRTSGTPVLGPRSPQRQLAMAKLGLLDDAEAEDLTSNPPR